MKFSTLCSSKNHLSFKIIILLDQNLIVISKSYQF
jgi:hypothetical protein